MEGNNLISVIQISSKHLTQIGTHAGKTYPEECCGLLLGKITNNNKIVREVWETENSWDGDTTDYFSVTANQGSKQNRFTIAPEVLLKAQRTARDRNLEIIGIYHSHPDHPAIPSQFDQAIAHPQYSYLIVSVQQGKVADIRSWELDDIDQFKEENIMNLPEIR